MSDKKCCVPGCTPCEVPHVLHGFPNPEKDRKRFNIWLMAIGGDILGLENGHIYKYRRVCHIHFEARFHCRNNRISNVAVPTLHLPGPLSVPKFSLSERRPLREIQNTEPSISKEPVALTNFPVTVEQMQVLPTATSSCSQFPVTMEQMEVMPTATSSSSQFPVTMEHMQVMPTATSSSSQFPVTMEQMQVMPTATSSCSQFPVTMEQMQVLPTATSSSSQFPVTMEQMQVMPTATSSCSQFPVTMEQMQVLPTATSSSSQFPVTMEQMQVMPTATSSCSQFPVTMEQMQVLPTATSSSSQFPVTMEQMQVMPTATSSCSQFPVTMEQMQVLPTATSSSSQFPVTMEQMQVMPTATSSCSQFPVTMEQMQVLPSSSKPQGIDKTACQNNINISTGGKRAFKKGHSTLTPKEKALKLKLVAAKIKISKLKSSAKKQLAELKSVRKLSSNPDILKILDSGSSTAKLLFQMQWREQKKNKKGRRFTLQEKIVALSILKQSPKGYRFFRKIFLLPAPQTLTKLVQKANLQPGINKNIFTQLQTRASSMKTEEKLCVLLYDEVSLKPNLTYNERKGRVTGFVDNGYETKPDFANHAQVFMVRGLTKNYKQPVAYTFSESATKGPELAKQIKNVVTEIQKSGLIVVATVCDQGTNNRQAIKMLLSETRGIYLRRGETPKDNIILINDNEIVPLYDPPHLLKGMRNNLMTKDLHFVKDGVTKVAKWSHLKQLYKENPGYKGIRLIPKLTENHINPEKMNKMKVKCASQIFSRTVASNMGYLADKGILQGDCKETADFLLFMDNLFDSVNGSYLKNKHAKPLLGPATPNSVHLKTWQTSKKILASMKFVTASGKIESIPSVQNWVWTLQGMEVLIKNVASRYGVTSVWLRHLNQDPLENFFGAIRSHGCRNTNPTCDQFESAFVALLINNLSSVHTHGKNCEEDFSDALHALVVDNNLEPSSTCNIPIGNIMDIKFTPLQDKQGIPSIIAPLQYVSGYVLKKTKTNIFKDCDKCKDALCRKEDIEYIKYREYAGQRWLCYPTEHLIMLVSDMQDITNTIFKKQLEIKYLKDN